MKLSLLVAQGKEASYCVAMTSTVTHGSALRAIREAKGLTQTELGARSGVSASHITNAESGVRNLSLDYALRIAHALKVEPDAITYQRECDCAHAVAEGVR